MKLFSPSRRKPSPSTPRIRPNSPSLPVPLSLIPIEPEARPGDSKECQTLLLPSPPARETLSFDQLLRSHRSSIEKFVADVFQGQHSKQPRGQSNHVPKAFTELLLDPANHRTSPEMPPFSPFSIAKAKMNRKKTVLACNKQFRDTKGKISGLKIGIDSPKKFEFSAAVVWKNPYKTVKAANIREIHIKRKRRLPRQQTPLTMHHITVEFGRGNETRALSATPLN
jgi:hypothetical protein